MEKAQFEKTTETQNANSLLDQNGKLDGQTFWEKVASPFCDRITKLQEDLENLNDDWIETCKKFAVEHGAEPWQFIMLPKELIQVIEDIDKAEGKPLDLNRLILEGICRISHGASGDKARDLLKSMS
jgi:hypothetical protein